MDAGAASCVSVIKVAEQRSVPTLTMSGLTDRYRR